MTKKTPHRKPAEPSASDARTRQDRKPRAPKAGGRTPVPEIGGRKGPDPTRYGDWEKNGRCIDF